jgi:hypothetical protein
MASEPEAPLVALPEGVEVLPHINVKPRIALAVRISISVLLFKLFKRCLN